jgi:hypothetical protein
MRPIRKKSWPSLRKCKRSRRRSWTIRQRSIVNWLISPRPFAPPEFIQSERNDPDLPFICDRIRFCDNRRPAQSSTPIIVQAVSSTTAKPAAAAAAATVQDDDSAQDASKLLEQIKAANDEILSKQKAALKRVDELPGAADQLKILSKRG